MGVTPDPERPEDAELDDEHFLTPPAPPEGGWGWVVVFASMMCNFIVDGVCFTFGIFINEYTEYYGSSKGKTALIGALIPGMYLGIGPVSSALANKFGFRAVTITGSIISSAAFFLSTLSPNVDILLVTYGILGGFGFGLIYLPSVVIVNFYFNKRRALATGIAVAGSGLGTIVFAPLGRVLLNMYGWKGSHMVLSGLILNCCVFGALYRPLEQNKPLQQPAASVTGDLPGTSVKRKNRQRLMSTGTFEGTLQKLEEEEEDVTSLASSLTVPVEVGSQLSEGSDVMATQVENFNAAPGSFRETSGSLSAPASAANKILERPKRRRTISLNPTGTPVGSKHSLETLKKEMFRPMYRKDIFYSGYVCNVGQQCQRASSDAVRYVPSIMSIPELPEEDDNAWSARCVPLVSVLQEMFDFSLFKSITFVLLCTSSVLAMAGFFTPFVYITDNAIRLGTNPNQAALLISIMGIFNTIGRVAAGWMSDQPWADCVIISSVSQIVGGAVTCLVPLLNTYGLLCIYCSIYGLAIACFISLRSSVLVELLGIEKLSNSFGLLLLCQGIASLVGSPLAGMIFDYTQSYTASFIISGLLVAIAGIIVLPIRHVAAWDRKRKERRVTPQHGGGGGGGGGGGQA